MNKNTFSLNDRFDFDDEFPFEKNRRATRETEIKSGTKGVWVEHYEIPGYYGSQLYPGRHEFIEKVAKRTCDIIQEEHHKRNIPYTTYMKDFAQACEYESFRDLYVRKGIVSDITYKEFLDRYYYPSTKMVKIPRRGLPTMETLKRNEDLSRRRKKAKEKLIAEAIAMGLIHED